MGRCPSGASPATTSRHEENPRRFSSGVFGLPHEVGEITEVPRTNTTTGTRMGRDYHITLDGFRYRIPAFRLRAFLNAEAELVATPNKE